MVFSAITSGAVLLIALLQVLPVAAVPAALNLDENGIGEIVWEIQTSPGGPTVNVTGTVQEVIRSAEKINPNFRSDFALDQPTEASSHDGQEKYEAFGFDCQPESDASVDHIGIGINYLRRVPGRPVMGPGTYNCGRVSCDWGASIYWCNQDPFNDKALDSFAAIAEGAQVIVDGCKQYHTEPDTHGRAYSKDNWSVRVTGTGFLPFC